MKENEAIISNSNESNQTISYLLSSLLKARQSLNCARHTDRYDEDVNVYLSHLLYDYAQPDYQDRRNRYVIKNRIDLMDRLEKAEDIGERYFIFKVNGDELLVGLGIFKNKGTTFRDAHRFWGHNAQFYEVEAKGFYSEAAQWNARIYHRQTAVSEILKKISHDLKKYVAILERVSDDYFTFFKHQFEKEFKRLELQALKDRFLDLYGKWLEEKDLLLKCEIEAVRSAIVKLDPSFRFEWSKEA